ncbi:hypothetical protein J4Q44_G00067770 [Coregonus suidteri]|uniref:ZP domain-containing protein n=1 Tax=Coregonus suidteri TaxID=861788 RepID=A0AAN8MDP3_9TELE
MKTVILLLSVAMALLDSRALPANAAAIQQRSNHVYNLEKIIRMAGQYTQTLPEDLLQTLVTDVTHLTETTTKCKEFFCEAETILASVKKDKFEGGEIVRLLRVYNNHKNCKVVEKSQGNQVELRRLLHDLKGCGQKINSKP